jgi:hypothetical protein
MPSTCGKGVYNLWIAGGKTCQNLSTYCGDIKNNHFTMWVKPSFIRSFIPAFPRASSTAIHSQLSPLIHSFPHSPQPLLLTTRRKN